MNKYRVSFEYWLTMLWDIIRKKRLVITLQENFTSYAEMKYEQGLTPEEMIWTVIREYIPQEQFIKVFDTPTAKTDGIPGLPLQ